jgi:hypothetical protein
MIVALGGWIELRTQELGAAGLANLTLRGLLKDGCALLACRLPRCFLEVDA